MIPSSLSNFHALTNAGARIKVVDIGANPIDGHPPYLSLLQSGNAEIVGFEPNPNALVKLQEAKGPNETYLPHAIGDGQRRKFYVCAGQGMSSLLEPNPAVLELFHAFPLWGEVEAIREIETVRLDDVAEAAGVELLKLDIQGAELLALRNAPRRLADALILHVEVEFIPLYVDQPLFSEVESFLRQSGFQFHRFLDQNIRIFSPMLMYDYLYGGMSQLLAADAIFVKDFTRLECLSDRQLIAMATILHDCYQSLDLVFRLISEYDRRNGTSLAGAYLTGLKAEVPGLGIAIGDCHSYAITRPAELPSA